MTKSHPFLLIHKNKYLIGYTTIDFILSLSRVFSKFLVSHLVEKPPSGLFFLPVRDEHYGQFPHPVLPHWNVRPSFQDWKFPKFI